MVRGFSTRKIETNKTLGEKLKAIRIEKDITLEDAEIGTKVRANYLAAIEKGDSDSLPSEVYVRGFVLAYAKYLEFDVAEATSAYHRECKLQPKRSHSTEISYKNSVKDYKVILTPKVVGYSFITFFIISLFGYIIFQVAHFAGSPNLKITSPGNGGVYVDDSIDLRGITDNDTFLTINDEHVPITNDGTFSTNLKLHRGINVIKVKAVNKSKKETSEVLTLEYKPVTAQIPAELPVAQ
ncbi:MAG: helix-turn-helix domain-containing protein [Candidatus Berkelbacteria bacterium]